MRMTSLAAVMLFAASSALAQGTTTSPGQNTSPSTAPSAAPSTGTGTTTGKAPGTTGQTGAAGQATGAPSTATPGTTAMQKQAGAGQLQYYNQKAGEMRASQLIGATVRNQQNESVGEINELILDKDGQVEAAVIGVGGFLGIGEREVAVDFNSLRFERDANSAGDRGAMTPKLAATKETLKNAPAWEWNDRGAASGTGNRPTTGNSNK